VTPRGARQRIVLAALLLRANTVVTVDDLIDCVWPDRAPATAREQILTIVSGVRRLLGDSERPPHTRLVVTRSPGYLLRVGPGQLDAHRFEGLVMEAERALACGRAADAATSLRAALALWRGRALADVAGPFAANEAHRLTELRLSTVEKLVEVEFGLGRHLDILPELAGMVAEHPLRERLRGQLMIALHAVGRTAEALAIYRAGRQVMVRELGLEPGPELRAIEHAILAEAGPGGPAAGGAAPPGARDTTSRTSPSPAAVHADRAAGGRNPHRPDGPRGQGSVGTGSGGAAPAASSGRPISTTGPGAGTPAGTADGPPGPGWQVPRQLPADLTDFVGRRNEIAGIRQHVVSHATDPTGTAPAVVAITGQPGVGKSSLAVRVGHLLRGAFPDGQLHVRLAGTAGPPVRPADALASMIVALGVPAGALPRSVTDRAALYRTLLADRRVLVVLDDAADAAQVRPLLPGSRGCAVLITARRDLADLAGAHHVRLGVLPGPDATALLAATAGTDRIALEHAAARRIVDLCAGLPLTVRIAGAVLAARPHRSVAELADRLADPRRRLDELRIGDLDVRADLTATLDALPPELAEAARRLAALDPPRFGIREAAAALNAAPPDAETLLEDLMQRHLVGYAGRDSRGESRFRLAELVRWYLCAPRHPTDPVEARPDAAPQLPTHRTPT